jgi:SAM-dependent methyltransferase
METSADTLAASAADRSAVRSWVAAFADYLPPRRPLTVLDVGSGAGRFTPALAEEFGGPVYGLEPSARRRAIAERDAAHPGVRYLDGWAERIPLPAACCDAALLFMSLHHVSGRRAAFAELARVSKPAASVLVRCEFADRLPDMFLYRYFPAARAATAAGRPNLPQVVADAVAAGFVPVTLDAHEVDAALPLRHVYARARELLTARPGPIPRAEVVAGLATMGRDAADDGDRLVVPPAADLLVLRRGPAL